MKVRDSPNNIVETALPKTPSYAVVFCLFSDCYNTILYCAVLCCGFLTAWYKLICLSNMLWCTMLSFCILLWLFDGHYNIVHRRLTCTMLSSPLRESHKTILRYVAVYFYWTMNTTELNSVSLHYGVEWCVALFDCVLNTALISTLLQFSAVQCSAVQCVHY